MASRTESGTRLDVGPGLTAVGRRLAVVGPPALLAALALTAWQAFVVLGDVPSVVLPPPTAVAVAGVEAGGTLLADAAVTAATAGLGLGAGVTVGLALAFAMVRSRAAAALVGPYLVALRITPIVAVAPLLFLWFGDGLPVRAALAATLATFPVAIASLDGLRSVPEAYLDVARSVAAPDRRTFLRVRVPAAAPSVFAGVKLGAVLSVVGTVVAEFVALDGGLGHRILVASTRLETALMYAALFVLAAVGVGFYLLPVAAERRVGW